MGRSSTQFCPYCLGAAIGVVLMTNETEEMRQQQAPWRAAS